MEAREVSFWTTPPYVKNHPFSLTHLQKNWNVILVFASTLSSFLEQRHGRGFMSSLFLPPQHVCICVVSHCQPCPGNFQGSGGQMWVLECLCSLLLLTPVSVVPWCVSVLKEYWVISLAKKKGKKRFRMITFVSFKVLLPFWRRGTWHTDLQADGRYLK